MKNHTARTVCLHRNGGESRRRRGFTLIEAAFTTMIVGVGLVAMLQLLASGTVANIEGAQGTSGLNLAKSIREQTLTMTFDQVLALNGVSHHPPIDGRGVAIADFADWTQTIQVQAVDRDRITADVVSPTPAAVRVTVFVKHDDRNICSLSWHRFKPMP